MAGPAAGSWEHRAAILDMVGKLPRRDSHGRPVQVDRIKPTLKAPRTERVETET